MSLASSSFSLMSGEARWAGATRGQRSSWVSERKDGSQVAVENDEDNFEVDSAMLAPLQGLSPSLSLSISLPLSASLSLHPPPPPPLSLSLCPPLCLSLSLPLSRLCGCAVLYPCCVVGGLRLVSILLSCALAEFHADQTLTGGGRLRAAVKRRLFLKSPLIVTF